MMGTTTVGLLLVAGFGFARSSKYILCAITVIASMHSAWMHFTDSASLTSTVTAPVAAVVAIWALMDLA